MKRIAALLVLLLLLSGCQSLYPDEYLAVNEHEAPFAYRETTAEPAPSAEPAPEYRTVSDVFAIRDGIQDMVLRGEESAQFLVSGSTKERVEAAMQEVENTLVSSSPKYTYAMDSFEWYLEQADAGAVVTVRMKLRLAPQEIRAIETWIYPEPAMSKIYGALSQFVSSYTIQISGYAETDFVALLEDYCLHHPEQIMETPGISVGVYPSQGNVRVVEFHFIHNTDRETLRQQRDDVNRLLEFVCSQLSRTETAENMVEILYMHLPGSEYKEIENATVYTQVSKKGGSSRTMASVVEYLCRQAGASCELVIGEREGEPWYFNRILSEGRWLYFDLHSAALSRRAPVLREAGEMRGYSWDPERYPETEQPEEPPETEGPSEPVSEPEPAAPTETAEPIETEEAPAETETKAAD